MAAIKSAILYAAYNAATSTTVVTASAVSMSLFDVLLGFGPRWVAVMFALIGALWRWYHYTLSFKQASAGALLSCAIAFIAGDTKLPILSTVFNELPPESVPMMNGLVLGLFGLLIVTTFQDFIRAYHDRKAGIK